MSYDQEEIGEGARPYRRRVHHLRISYCLLPALVPSVVSCGEPGGPTEAHQAPGEIRLVVPPSRAGLEMLGKSFSLKGVHWLRSPDGKPVELAGRVTLIRWWTDTCPFCEASLPAIDGLRREFADQGFQTIAVYHPKPPRRIRKEVILRAAENRHYAGPVAMDRNWDVLERIYLHDHPDTPTSVSFLLDRDARVRYFHPGPIFCPTDDPAQRPADQDYRDVRAAIQALLQTEADPEVPPQDPADSDDR